MLLAAQISFSFIVVLSDTTLPENIYLNLYNEPQMIKKRKMTIKRTESAPGDYFIPQQWNKPNANRNMGNSIGYTINYRQNNYMHNTEHFS